MPNAANWSNGFLPAHFQGTPLRPEGTPLLDLAPPPGVTRTQQRANLDLLARLNALDEARHPGNGDLAARMRSYELAFRMQAEVPELVSIEREDQRTKDLYGIGQPTTDNFGRRCLLARKLVEQGVRFVQVWSSGWKRRVSAAGTSCGCAALPQPRWDSPPHSSPRRPRSRSGRP